MFGKKSCQKCRKKISNKYSYCPYCGTPYDDEEDWGMLGKNDTGKESEAFSNSMFGGISGKMINKMLSGTMKMLEKEMQKGMQQEKQVPLRTNFELFINGKRISPENIKVTRNPVRKQIEKKIPENVFSQETMKRFTTLPKEEPSTNVRRLSDKVVYEIDIPGVSSIEDVSIAKLENSIEIKAVAKEKAYKKVIPINLPLRRYKLDQEKLILELGVKN